MHARLDVFVKTISPLCTALASTPLNPHTVWRCCTETDHAVSRCCTEAVDSVTFDWLTTPGATDLKNLQLKYRTEVFANLLDKVTPALSGDSLQRLSAAHMELPTGVFNTLLNCSVGLFMGNWTWPHRDSVSFGLIQAVSRFARSTAWTIPMSDGQRAALAISFSQICHNLVTTKGPIAPASLWVDVSNMMVSVISNRSSAISGRAAAGVALQAISVGGSPRFDRADLAAGEKADVDICKLAVVVASESELMMPGEMGVLKSVLEKIGYMQLYSWEGSDSNGNGSSGSSSNSSSFVPVSLMNFTKGLHGVWNKYSTLSEQVLTLLQKLQVKVQVQVW